MKCKFSNDKIKTFMSFGKIPMANALLAKKNFKTEHFNKLEVGINKKNYLFQINYFIRNLFDYTILNLWNHRKEILNKEKKYLIKGGKFISYVK